MGAGENTGELGPPGGEGEAVPSPSDRERLNRRAAEGLVAYYFEPRETKRTDGAPPETDYLESLYRDLVVSVFEHSPEFRIYRPDGVAVGLLDPSLAIQNFVYDLLRAAGDPTIDSPYRERAVLTLALAMVLRAALPEAETAWRAMRRRATRIPDSSEVESYRRVHGTDPPAWSPRLVLPDLRKELEALGGDASLPRAIRELASEATFPFHSSEYLAVARKWRSVLASLGVAATGSGPSEERRVPQLSTFVPPPDVVVSYSDVAERLYAECRTHFPRRPTRAAIEKAVKRGEAARKKGRVPASLLGRLPPVPGGVLLTELEKLIAYLRTAHEEAKASAQDAVKQARTGASGKPRPKSADDRT